MAQRRLSINKQLEIAKVGTTPTADMLPVSDANGELQYVSKADFLADLTSDNELALIAETSGTPSVVTQADLDAASGAGSIAVTLPRFQSGATPPFRQVHVNGNLNATLTTSLNTPAGAGDDFIVTVAGIGAICEVGDTIDVVAKWRKN